MATTVWYTADHHFGHANIIGYCDRPFPDARSMEEALIERWNYHVGPDDEVWVLGDLTIGRNTETLARCAARLNGVKVLVPGNHDRCWQGRKDHEHERGPYYRIGGFDRIVDNPEPHLIGGHSVQVNHFPWRLDPQYDQKYSAWRPAEGGGWLIHGHIHEKWRQNGRQVNVGVDAWDYAPVAAEQIAALIEAGPASTDRIGRPRTAPY